MRVVVNRHWAMGRKTGVGNYTCELLRCLRQQGGTDRIDPYPHDWMWQSRLWWARLRRGLEGPPPTPGMPGVGEASPADAVERPASVIGRSIQYLRGWGRRLREGHYDACFTPGRYDLYHEPNHIPFPTDLPTVTTIHDLSVLLHPEWHPAERNAFFSEHFSRGLADTQHILTVSEFTRQEVICHVGFAPQRVTAIYNGIRPGLRPMPAQQVAAVQRKLGLPPRYLLYLGTIEPRKNILMLLRAYCSLPAPLREKWPLLLVGGWGWNTADAADYFDTEAKHRGVRHVGYIADQHIPAIYNGARALVYPSLYEGFGLPPVEMMACGGAVLASTAAALVETVGSRAHLIDPLDEDGWRKAMERVVSDDEWWQSLRDGVEEVARPFSWDRCAAQTLRVYRRVCGETGIPLPDRRRAAG